MKRVLAGTAAAAALALATALWLILSSGRGPAQRPLSSATHAPVTHPAAALPGCVNPEDVAALLLAATPAGAASHSITGQRVSTSFSLGNGMFVADPPPDVRPAVTAEQAGCLLASSFLSYGWPAGPGRLALASVTLRPQAGSAVPSYQHQLTWLLVGADDEPSPACPTAGPSPHPSLSAPANPYEVFLLDATTGTPQVEYSDAILACNVLGRPGVGFVTHIESLPWTLVSRSSDGDTVTVTADWNSCQHFDGIVGPDGEPKGAASQDNPTQIEIYVDGATGPSCGQPTPHVIDVGPMVAGHALSPVLLHAPVGFSMSAAPG
jgi:hypothetical protein